MRIIATLLAVVLLAAAAPAAAPPSATCDDCDHIEGDGGSDSGVTGPEMLDTPSTKRLRDGHAILAAEAAWEDADGAVTAPANGPSGGSVAPAPCAHWGWTCDGAAGMDASTAGHCTFVQVRYFESDGTSGCQVVDVSVASTMRSDGGDTVDITIIGTEDGDEGDTVDLSVGAKEWCDDHDGVDVSIINAEGRSPSSQGCEGGTDERDIVDVTLLGVEYDDRGDVIDVNTQGTELNDEGDVVDVSLENREQCDDADFVDVNLLVHRRNCPPPDQEGDDISVTCYEKHSTYNDEEDCRVAA